MIEKIDAEFLRDLHRTLRTVMLRHGWPETAVLYEAEGTVHDVWLNLHTLAKSIQQDRGEGWPAFVEEASEQFQRGRPEQDRVAVGVLISLAAGGVPLTQT
jgi:hypothetical protein